MAAACVRAKLPRRDGASGRARVAPTADPSSYREASIGQYAPPRPARCAIIIIIVDSFVVGSWACQTARTATSRPAPNSRSRDPCARV